MRAIPVVGRWRIYAICNARREAQAVEFLVPGGPEDRHAGSKRQMWAYLEHVAQLPNPPRNTAVSHYIDEENRILEFIKGDIRLVYFFDEDTTIILSHCFLKDGQKTPKAQLVRARSNQVAYFQAKEKRDLRYFTLAGDNLYG